MFIDSHVHLNDEQYDYVESIVKNYQDEGIEFVINCGYNIPSSIKGKELSEKFDSVFFAAGVHPSDCMDYTEKSRQTIEELLMQKKAVALGEIGLDYHYDGIDRNLQKKVFVEQAELASSLNMPIVIHSRDATKDMLEVIKTNKNYFKKAVMHCYSGSVETAKILLDMGLYISFSGTLTFKNCRKLDEVCKIVPLDRLLAETDCPYLSPEPYRGRRNEPKNVKLVYEKLAYYRNETIKEIAEAVKHNVHNLFTKTANK